MNSFRTFRAPDARSALAMVKAALGSQAVILSTRDVSNGLFRPKEIEVTAALAAPTPIPPPKAAPLQLPTKQTPPNLVPSRANTAELVDLRSAMEDMRREMRGVSQQVRIERELKLPPNAAELFAHLLSRGVEETLAQESVREAVEVATNGTTETLLDALRSSLSARVTGGRAPWVSDGNGQRVVALVGPTGVGKTTTLAKIAARAIMEEKLKVALITVDTYRIGASEQVMRYGEIMSIPTFVARDRVELTRVLERCANADLVLVDTAGRSVSEAVARQAEMLRVIDGISLCLVMSACTGHREMAAAADRYRTLQPEQLIVTKTDEAVGPGSLLTASVRIGQPIVAVADGQRVPEDIHTLSSVELINLVIGPFHSSRPDIAVNVGGR